MPHSSLLFIPFFFFKTSEKDRELWAGTGHPSPQVGEPSDYSKKGVWGHFGVKAAKGMFDRADMTSGIFHKLVHSTWGS